MKEFIIIKDPEVAKLFADENRREILHNLRHREMTACQLARLLEKNVSSIAYHLNALEEAGLVKQSRTEVKGNLIEKFYNTTAQKFIISYTLSEGLVPGSEDIAQWSKEVCRAAVESLEAFGYKVPAEEKEKLIALFEQYAHLENVAFEELISEQNLPVKVMHPSLRLLLSLLTNIRFIQDPEYMALLKKISDELKR